MKNKRNLTLVRIGFINEKDMVFHSVYNISRREPGEEIIFRNEPYKRVSEVWDCYIKKSDYQKLFSL